MKKLLLHSIAVAAIVATVGGGCRQSTEPSPSAKAPAGKPVSLTVGHVGHDHHSALFVALDAASARWPGAH